jgi:hypothetical protein
MNCQKVWESVKRVSQSGDLEAIEAAGFQASAMVADGIRPEFWGNMVVYLRKAYRDTKVSQDAGDRMLAEADRQVARFFV